MNQQHEHDDEDDDLEFVVPGQGLRGRAPRRQRARRPARPDAPLGGPHHGRGGDGAVPGHQAGHRPRHQGRLLLRLRPAADADAGGPRAHRGADARSRSPPITRSSAASGTPTRAAPTSRPRASRTRSRSSTTCAPPRRSRASPPPAVTTYQHGPVHRPVPRPARRVHRQAGPLQAAQDVRCLLARPRGPADAPAHLRHGLEHPGGARPVPVAPARRPASATTAGSGVDARPVQLPRRQPRLRLLASQGPEAVAHARGRHARAPGPPRLPGDQHADPGPQEAVGAVGPLGPLQREHVQGGGGGPDLQPQAHELPREHVHLQEPHPVLPGPAAAPQRVRPAAPQRAVRGTVGPHARAPLHPGRRPHLRPPGPAGRRDHGAPGRGRGDLLLVRADGRASRSPRARRRPWAIRPPGSARSRSSRRPSTPRA